MILKKTAGLLFILGLIAFCSQPAYAQQEKGDVEVLVFSGGFFIGLDDDNDFKSVNIGAKAGYFLTRRHEVGAGFSFSVITDFFEGDDGDETDVALGLVGFYRFNFASKDAKGFPFIGADIGVGDVTEDFGRQVSLRPNVGFKYFIKKNVALDFSVGYSADLNRIEGRFFDLERRRSIDGQIGLAFVF